MEKLNPQPSKTLREWVEYYESSRSEKSESKNYSRPAKTMQGVRSIIRRLHGAAKTGVDALRTTHRLGRPVQECFGIPFSTQLTNQYHFARKYNLSAASYYEHRLYLPERWDDVDEYIYKGWPLHSNIIRRSFPQEGVILDDKLQFYQKCRAHQIPTPPVLVLIEKGNISYLSGESLPACSLFVKERNGRQGRGARHYEWDGEKYVTRNIECYTSTQLVEHLSILSLGNGSLIVQAALRNHESWQRFTSRALATVRIVTARLPEGGVEPIAATLRMPTGNSDVDNFVGGGIASAIDIKTGMLSPGVRKETEDGVFELTHHPDTQRRFAGTTLSHWCELVDFMCETHAKFQSIFIGWDVALTTLGLMVIEGNKVWMPKTVEIPQGIPLSRTRFAVLYDAWMNRLLSVETCDGARSNVVPTNLEPDDGFFAGDYR